MPLLSTYVDLGTKEGCRKGVTRLYTASEVCNMYCAGRLSVGGMNARVEGEEEANQCATSRAESEIFRRKRQLRRSSTRNASLALRPSSTVLLKISHHWHFKHVS